MKTRAKILLGLLGTTVAVAMFAYVQQRRQQAMLAAVRSSIAVGDSKEAVERVLRESALPLEIADGGRSYTAHIWFHFRRDVLVTVVLNDHAQVDAVLVKDLLE